MLDKGESRGLTEPVATMVEGSTSLRAMQSLVSRKMPLMEIVLGPELVQPPSEYTISFLEELEKERQRQTISCCHNTQPLVVLRAGAVLPDFGFRGLDSKCFHCRGLYGDFIAAALEEFHINIPH